MDPRGQEVSPSVGFILDASAALAWLVQRVDPREAQLADEMLLMIQQEEALVPSLWFSEVANGLLVAERRGKAAPETSAWFLSKIGELSIAEDVVRPAMVQGSVLALARLYALTAYDATYLELAQRTGRALATFDRQLAAAVRKSGGKVVGDQV